MAIMRSNHPKTKKAMKQTMKYLSMAALVVMGAIVASCAKEEPAQPEEITPEVVEPVAEDNIVVCTTTVSFDNSADTDETKALDEDGVKTFAIGEMIAVIYKNDSDQTVKAVSAALEAEDIASGDKSATFHVTLVNPGTDAAVRIIYPAAMAASTVATNVAVDADATINYAALNTQDGTLATLSSNLDLAVYDGTLSGTSLPADPALKNKLAICEYTIKDDATPTANDLTSTITGMTISDGTHNYSVSRSAAAGPIYVAIRPTDNADINYTATDGTNHYKKTVTGKTYAASQMYPLGLRMAAASIIDLSSLHEDYVAQHGDVLINTLAEKHQISIADGAAITLQNANINYNNTWQDGLYAGITCVGDATIILSGTNIVKGFEARYPGIFVPESKTLIIKGDGSLTSATGIFGPEVHGCGIGGVCAFDQDHAVACGNIEIQGGTITATAGNNSAGIGSGGYGSCGSITISGGNVTVTSQGGAGIGSGYQASCGNILISGGTVNTTGGYGGAGIGGGMSDAYRSSCGTITINGGTVTASGGDYAPGIGTGHQNNTSEQNADCGNIYITTGVTSVTVYPGGGSDNAWIFGSRTTIGKGYRVEDWTGKIYIGADTEGVTFISGTVYNPWVYPEP